MPEHTYYIVVYKSVPNASALRHNPDLEPAIHNEILVDVHPVVWLARPTPDYDACFTSILLFFAEIPEAVVLDQNVTRYFDSPQSEWE